MRSSGDGVGSASAAGALQYAKNREGSTDWYTGAEVLLFGNGGVTFQGESGPAPTESPAAPAVTPTPAETPVPTETPEPTATPTPAPAIAPMTEQQSDPLYALYAAYIKEHFVGQYGIYEWETAMQYLNGETEEASGSAMTGVVSVCLGDFDNDGASEAVVFYSRGSGGDEYSLYMAMLDVADGAVVQLPGCAEKTFYTVDVAYNFDNWEEVTVSVCKTAGAGDYIKTVHVCSRGDAGDDIYGLYHIEGGETVCAVEQDVFMNAYGHNLLLRDSIPSWMTGDFRAVPTGINPYWSEETWWDPSESLQGKLCIYAGGREASENASGRLNENGIMVYRPNAEDAPEEFLCNDVYASLADALRAVMQPVDGAAEGELLHTSYDGRNAMPAREWLGMA